MRPQGKILPVWFTPLIFVRLLLEVQEDQRFLALCFRVRRASVLIGLIDLVREPIQMPTATQVLFLLSPLYFCSYFSLLPQDAYSACY